MAPYAEIIDSGSFKDQVEPGNIDFLEGSEITSLQQPTERNPMTIENQERSWENLLNITNSIKLDLGETHWTIGEHKKFTEFTDFLEKADPNVQEMLTKGLFYGNIKNNEGQESVVLAYPVEKTEVVRHNADNSDLYLFNMIVHNKSTRKTSFLTGPNQYNNPPTEPIKYVLDTLRGNVGGKQWDFNGAKFIESFMNSAPVIKELADAGLFDTRSPNQTETLLNTFSQLANSNNESVENPTTQL